MITVGGIPANTHFAQVMVEADVLTDGHDAISCVLLYRKDSDPDWSEAPMAALVNDRWRSAFPVAQLGRYRYTIQAWVNRFKTWSRDLAKRVDAGQDVTVDLLIGAELVEAAQARAGEIDAGRLGLYAQALRSGGADGAQQALSAELAGLMDRHAERPSVDHLRQRAGGRGRS